MAKYRAPAGTTSASVAGHDLVVDAAGHVDTADKPALVSQWLVEHLGFVPVSEADIADLIAEVGADPAAPKSKNTPRKKTAPAPDDRDDVAP